MSEKLLWNIWNIIINYRFLGHIIDNRGIINQHIFFCILKIGPTCDMNAFSLSPTMFQFHTHLTFTHQIHTYRPTHTYWHTYSHTVTHIIIRTLWHKHTTLSNWHTHILTQLHRETHIYTVIHAHTYTHTCIAYSACSKLASFNKVCLAW